MLNDAVHESLTERLRNVWVLLDELEQEVLHLECNGSWIRAVPDKRISELEVVTSAR